MPNLRRDGGSVTGILRPACGHWFIREDCADCQQATRRNLDREGTDPAAQPTTQLERDMAAIADAEEA